MAKRLPVSKRQTSRIVILVTEYVHRELEKRAAERGLSLADYGRRKLLDHPLPAPMKR